MPAIRMTSLTRAPNGDWFARKMIPEDVRAAYKVAFGVSQEARFRAPGSSRADAAKQSFRDWDAEVTSRIERLRAEARGEGLPALTPRQAMALAGEWYVWFVQRFQDEPGEVEDWESRFEEIEVASSTFEDPSCLPARRLVHAKLTALGHVEEVPWGAPCGPWGGRQGCVHGRPGAGVRARAGDPQEAGRGRLEPR